MWRLGVVVIPTAQFHSTKRELRFCAGSNHAPGVSEICDGEDLWQWSQLELNAFCRSVIPQKQFILRYLLKRGMTWNNLKRPTTNKKQPETTCNKQEMTWNNLQWPRPITNTKRPWSDPQRARNDLRRSTTSKTQPTTTQTYLQQAKKDAQRPTTSRFWDYFTIWGNWFSFLTRFQPNIWLQSFIIKHCFTENYGENRAPNISILSCVFISDIKFTGYLRCEPLWHL